MAAFGFLLPSAVLAVFAVLRHKGGTPRSLLAERHQAFLIHCWDETKLAAGMQMLHDAGFGPFTQMVDVPVNRQDSSHRELVTSPKIP